MLTVRTALKIIFLVAIGSCAEQAQVALKEKPTANIFLSYVQDVWVDPVDIKGRLVWVIRSSVPCDCQCGNADYFDSWVPKHISGECFLADYQYEIFHHEESRAIDAAAP